MKVPNPLVTYAGTFLDPIGNLKRNAGKLAMLASFLVPGIGGRVLGATLGSLRGGRSKGGSRQSPARGGGRRRNRRECRPARGRGSGDPRPLSLTGDNMDPTEIEVLQCIS